MNWEILSSEILSVDFLSNDFELIVCGNKNGAIFLFSTKKNDVIWVNEESSGHNINSIKVSPNRHLVAGGGSKGCLLVIDAANGNSICSVNVDSLIWRVLFLSQQKIACALRNGTMAIVCWKTQKIVKILKIGEKSVYVLVISPVNNDIVLTGDRDGVIKQTIISSEKTVMVYEGHNDHVFDLNFLSCGSMFVSGSNDRTARLFALDQKQAIRVFQGHTDSIFHVSLILDDELLITTSFDRIVKIWKIESGECLSTITTEQDVRCSAVTKDEKSLVIGGFSRNRFCIENWGKISIIPCPLPYATSLDRNLKLCFK